MSENKEPKQLLVQSDDFPDTELSGDEKDRNYSPIHQSHKKNTEATMTVFDEYESKSEVNSPVSRHH